MIRYRDCISTKSLCILFDTLIKPILLRLPSIGGVGKHVEINEAKFRRMKHHRRGTISFHTKSTLLSVTLTVSIHLNYHYQPTPTTATKTTISSPSPFLLSDFFGRSHDPSTSTWRSLVLPTRLIVIGWGALT
eukprot:sb/3474892/